jgi:hypothetical protein
MAKKVLTPTPKFKPGDLLRINSGAGGALSCYIYAEDSDGNPAAVMLASGNMALRSAKTTLFSLLNISLPMTAFMT